MAKDDMAFSGGSDQAYPLPEYLGPYGGKKIVPAVPATQANRPQLRPVLPIVEEPQR